MTLPPEKLADMRVKHLEMLQTVVSRMSGYGASFKSYCITVTTAVIGFALTLHRPSVVALALLPISFFALADAQYLRVERQLRGTFDLVRKQDWAATPSFEIDLRKAPAESLFRCLTSWSIASFYGALAIADLIAILGARFYG
jgi:hypothetical protein